MTNLERLIKAEGLQGGTIADYDRRFHAHALSGKSLSSMTMTELQDHATSLVDSGLYTEARLISKATIAHMTVRSL